MGVMVLYLPGDGAEYIVDVSYLANDFPRGADRRTCAFCHGDPLGEQPGDSLIRMYYRRSPTAETCPMCQGRPS